MRRCWPTLWIALSLTAASYGQALGARDLYYESSPLPAEASQAGAHGAQPGPAPAKHLGLRYNLLKVTPATRATEVVDPDANFRENDCFAIEFMPNQAGNLFVFNTGSSGQWQKLLPSSEMPDEASVVKAGVAVRVPVEYCFQLDDKKGVEVLSVVVTNNALDADRLRALARNASGGLQQVSAQVKDWQKQQIVGRDLLLETAPSAGANGAPPHSVYAVQKADSPSGRIVLEIRIRHE